MNEKMKYRIPYYLFFYGEMNGKQFGDSSSFLLLEN